MKQVIFLLSTCLVSGMYAAASYGAPPSSSPQAQTLEQLGHQALDQGNPRRAYDLWEHARQLYENNEIEAAIAPLLINQSIALQRLGHPIKACTKLVLVLQKPEYLCQSHVQQADSKTPLPVPLSIPNLSQTNTIIAQINLGKVLHQLGNLSQAKGILQQAYQKSQALNRGEYRDTAALELADLEQLAVRQTIERAQRTDRVTTQRQLISQAKREAQAALKSYETLFSSDVVAPQAQLHWLNLYGKLVIQEELPGFTSLVQGKTRLHQETILALLQDTSSPSVSDLYRQLSLARHLLTLTNTSSSRPLIEPRQEAFKITQTAIRDAQSFQDQTLVALGYQTLGELYLSLNQKKLGQNAFLKASQIARTHSNWQGIYQAQRQLAGLWAQENPSKAIAAYERAIASLNHIRQDLLPTNADIQLSFRDNVEPIYHDYMKLLLEQPTIDFQRVIDVNETLRVTELIDFLNCGQLNWISLNQLKSKTPSDAVNIIHILNIGDDIHVIAQLPNGFHHHQTEANVVQSALSRFRLNRRSDRFFASNERQVQALSEILYQQLIEPFAGRLIPNTTLAFSLDSTFQGFPMALLYDGNQYLLEQHPISTNFGSRVLSLPSPPLPFKVLIAGLSTVSPSFGLLPASTLSPLPAVNQEVKAIATLSKTSKLLLNETFTLPRLQASIESQRFPYLHIATHGSFSSDSEETYLLAWNQKIKLNDLEQLIQPLTSATSPLELLVLSACETAQGDRRAALGLAGLATQSGAKSTLASLWKIDDQSSSQLMAHFYTGLKSGLSKAEALRQAQLTLLQSETYSAPYYWAPFILLGHWN